MRVPCSVTTQSSTTELLFVTDSIGMCCSTCSGIGVIFNYPISVRVFFSITVIIRDKFDKLDRVC